MIRIDFLLVISAQEIKPAGDDIITWLEKCQIKTLRILSADLIILIWIKFWTPVLWNRKENFKLKFNNFIIKIILLVKLWHSAFHFNCHCLYFFSCRSIKKNSFHQITTLLKKSCQKLSKTLQFFSCWWNANCARKCTELHPSAHQSLLQSRFWWFRKDNYHAEKEMNESVNCIHKYF